MDDLITEPVFGLYMLYNGKMPYNKAADTLYWDNINRGLKVLNDYLNAHTFLVGHRLTAADLTAATTLFFAFSNFIGANTRSKYPNVVRYYTTVINQRALGGVVDTNAQLASDDAKFVPPKKEKPAKPEAAPAAGGGAAAAAPAGGEEKPKNPLDALPKSSFNLNEWKMMYTNKDTRKEALPWFYEHFDPEGWSIWRFDFKYNDELTQIFMSSNQIGGFFTRLEASRKYVQGTAGVFGKANDSLIAGVIVLRGHDWEPVLSVAADIESYAVSPLDINKPEDKKFFEDMLAWEAVIDGKEWADGKMLK